METNVVYGEKVIKKWHKLKASAKARGIYFDMSLAHVDKMNSAQFCYFTGNVLNKGNRSIDRVDNNLGYIDSNTVACDIHFNHKKSNLTPDEINVLYKGVIERQAYPNTTLKEQLIIAGISLIISHFFLWAFLFQLQ